HPPVYLVQRTACLEAGQSPAPEAAALNLHSRSAALVSVVTVSFVHSSAEKRKSAEIPAAQSSAYCLASLIVVSLAFLHSFSKLSFGADHRTGHKRSTS